MCDIVALSKGELYTACQRLERQSKAEIDAEQALGLDPMLPYHGQGAPEPQAATEAARIGHTSSIFCILVYTRFQPVYFY